MDERTDHGPTRRTVLAGAAAVGAAWTVPVVLSGTPAAAQVSSGCTLVSATATGVCTELLGSPYGIEFSVTMSGCTGLIYAVEILEDGTRVACFFTSSTGGFVGRLVFPLPKPNTNYTVRLHENSCDDPEIGSTNVVGSTPLDCGTSGAAAPSDGTSSPGS